MPRTYRCLQISFVVLMMLVGIMSSHLATEGEMAFNIHNYQRLRNDIMNRTVAVHKIPPDLFHKRNSSYRLSFMVWLVDISDIDEIKQVITVNLFIEIRWKQVGLSWNVSDYNGIDFVLLETNTLWTPVILVVMGDKNSFVLDFAQTLQVNSNGEVISSRHNYLTFTCSINFKTYPFDVQTCKVGFFPTGNHTTPEFEVRDIYDYPLFDYNTVSGEWIFDNITYSILRTSDDWSNVLQYSFTMRRQRTYYVITFIFPVTLTSVMIPLAFLIPVQTGEKISYIVAVFTSTAIFINYISDVMPRSLSSMPYLAIFLIEVLVEGLLALLASLLVLNIYLIEERYTEKRTDPSVKPKDEKELKSGRAISDLCPGSLAMSRINSRRLDMIFFVSFVTGQGLFLWIIFGETDWL